MMAPLEVLVVGGGLHGVHLANVLLGHVGAPPEGLLIVDPASRLLEVWERCTQNIGMAFLRSPAVHHLDLSPWALFDFAGARPGKGQLPDFTRPYDRPSTALFASHCADVIRRNGLADRHHRGRVTRLDLDGALATAELDDGTILKAKQVILALGMSDQPSWPAWALALRDAGGVVRHVFDPNLDLDPARCRDPVVVIGAGISGAQAAMRLAEAGRRVTLLSRHPLREHQFDSDPGWVGPRYMEAFERERDLQRRRALIQRARHRGSLPPDVHQALRAALRSGLVRWQSGEVVQAKALLSGRASLRLAEGRMEVGEVLLATGFEPRRPGGALVDDLVARYGLRCAPCGFPIVDQALRWHPRLHVTGALAELELGPTARNIVGARRAGERLRLAMRQALGMDLTGRAAA